MQVELDSGKRVKVKAANVLLQFEQPAPAELLARAQALADDIDLDLAWEFAPEAEFGFADLARDYFDAKAGAVQQAAALLRLFDAPHYFRRVGKGAVQARRREETVQGGAARHRAQEAGRRRRSTPGPTSWSAGDCPAPVREQLYRILFKPDKNAPEYKAVVEAARARAARAARPAEAPPARSTAPYQFHWRRFLFEQFPHGTGFAGLAGAARSRTSCRWPTCRRSRSTTRPTTEIDDALSVQGLGSGTVVLGIHIAAPALAIAPDIGARQGGARAPVHRLHAGLEDDDAARRRGAGLHADRGPRLPGAEPVRDASTKPTLRAAGASRRGSNACRSPPTCATTSSTRVVTEASLDGRGAGRLPVRAPNWRSCSGWRATLKARREQVRGKPENVQPPRLQLPPRARGATAPSREGDERVQITPRMRGAPLDLIVAEAMILANSTLGRLAGRARRARRSTAARPAWRRA